MHTDALTDVDTHKHSHRHAGPSQVDLSTLPHTGSHFSPEPKSKPALEGWTFPLFLMATSSEGAKSFGEREGWTAPRVKRRPFSQRKRDCQMHHSSEGPQAFVQPHPSPRVRNPHGRGTCTLRCLAFLPDHTQVPGTLELPESGASSPDHPP